MPILQLELNLWEQLREAETAPAAIDFRQLCLSFDAELERMTAKEKMIQGADAIQQLADLLALRAESYFEEWQQRFDPVGPSLDTDDFTDLIRQSFSLELDELIEEPEATYRLPSETDHFNNSLVAEIDKEDLLDLLESQEPEKPLTIEQLEYDEDISAWIAVVRSWIEATGVGQAELMDVIKGTAMSPVMVWMALLLGGFELEKQGDFYQGRVLVG